MATKTDASQWEYETYAPKGERCSACMKPITSLELVHRGSLERASGAPIVVYRHIKCVKVSA